jgi:hypothetical protein
MRLTVTCTLLLLALGSADTAVPTTCGEFSVKSDDAVTCAATLSEGFTYTLATACDSVSGRPVLRLLDELANEVAYNDGFPFCGNASAALVEYFYPCLCAFSRQHSNALSRLPQRISRRHFRVRAQRGMHSSHVLLRPAGG